MINTRIALGLMSVLAALALVAAATFAFFTSSGTSSDNTFTSGTLSLFLDDVDELAVDGTVQGSITASGFAPGQSTSGYISLDNDGSIAFAEVEMGIDTSITNNPDATGDMSTVLILEEVRFDDATPDTACVGGANIASTIDAQAGNNDGTLRLSEFDDGVGTNVYDAFPGIAAGDTRNVCFVVRFESTAGNEFQGDTASSSITFTANQDASQ